jgi:hypothetical protein
VEVVAQVVPERALCRNAARGDLDTVISPPDVERQQFAEVAQDYL